VNCTTYLEPDAEHLAGRRLTVPGMLSHYTDLDRLVTVPPLSVFAAECTVGLLRAKSAL